MLNLDTKSTKVPAATDDDDDEVASPKAQEASEFKSSLKEAFQSSIQQEHAGSDGVVNRKSKKFTLAEDVESRPDAVEPEENGYANGLEAHQQHHHSTARSRKATHKDESPVDYFAKEKPLPLVPKSNIEQLDLLKSSLPIHKYVEPSGLPLPLHLPRPSAEMENLYPRPNFLPYPLVPPYSAGGESTLPFFLHQFYQHPLLFSVPEDYYRKEPPKDVRPSSPPRRSPSKEAPFFPPRVDPNQSSAVAPIH